MATPRLTALTAGCLLALGGLLSGGMAWAGGGAGGASANTLLAGGAGGTETAPTGGSGATGGHEGFTTGGGGGGGGTSLSTGDGGAGGNGGGNTPVAIGGAGGAAGATVSITGITTSVAGGAGGAGAAPTTVGNNFIDGGGSGGGGGGTALRIIGGTRTVTGAVDGGNGGNGGNGGADDTYGGGGGGGQGGVGIVRAATTGDASVGAGGVVRGGNGGNGGNAGFAGATSGSGGDAGTAIVFGGTGTLTNAGTIAGGNGGATGGGTAAGAGGVGITADGGATIVNSGSISGGLSGNGSTRADASQFTGGGNTLQLLSGSAITGNVVASAAGGDTLNLAGTTTTGAFDTSTIGATAQYRNFSNYQKTAAGTWTLTGTTTASTPWTVTGGILSIASDASLGADAGALTLNGGTLEATATMSGSRAVTLGAAGGGVNVAAGATLSWNGVVSGAGALTKDGAGTLVLTGTGTYSGATSVDAGGLRVNGTVGTGAVNVAAGASLGGSGTVGGAVTVANGGALQLTQGQTLTTGTLTLNNTSMINAELGTPGSNIPLAQVNGALTLDGQLNVIDLGGFGAGVYRLMNYAGALIDNGLQIGTVPAASSVSVQTAVAQQVNLVNSAGQTLAFWDGNSIASVNNGAIDGGSGSWTTTGSHWTNAAGTLNAPMTPQPGFAIFQGAPGTVTVNNTPGNVSVTGMQFAADGYLVQGDPITLAAAQAIIRVGDGSTAGAQYVATISAPLTGTARLEKTDAGTLVLTGANTYSGGTLVSGGTLQGNTTSLQGNIANNAHLTFDQATDGSYAGMLSGTGALRKTGAGALTLAAANGFSGGTAVDAGTLNAATTGALGTSAVAVNAGTLRLSGTTAGGDQTLTAASGATIDLVDQSSAAASTVVNNAGATLQIANLTTAGTRIGSIEGAGNVLLGAKSLTVGDLGTSTIVAGTISGTGGSLVKAGAGKLTLTGDNSYTGGTTIAGGTLQLGNGGATGSVTGNVVNDGTLAINRSNATTLAATISGTGSVAQVGTGVTTLSGANSYAGGTLVAAGSLTGSATSFGSGMIVNNAALILDQASDAPMANAISGTGTLTKTGGASLNLTGDSGAFAGATQVAAGTLAVNGTLGGALTIGNGATLKGNGTVGSTTVLSGGTVAPGNSLGVLTVNGNLTLANGSTYQIEASNDGRSDRIHATGAATLQGANAMVLAADGNWNPDMSYRVLSADGGVSGTFGSVTTNFAFLDPRLSYDAENVTLRLARNNVSFQSLATTLNQRNSASALEFAPGSALYRGVVQLSAPAAVSAFDQLSGEIHASLRSSLVEDSHFVRDAAIDRLRQTQNGAAAPSDMKVASDADGATWGRVYGSWGKTRSDGNAAAMDRSTSGIVVGADRQVGDWRVGVLGGASRSRIDVDPRSSTATVDNYNLGVFGGTRLGELSLRTGVTYSRHDIETDRTISIPGLFDATSAKYHGNTLQAFGELGWRFESGPVVYEPFANVAHVSLRTDAFRERGGVAALTSYRDRTENTFTTIGLRASSAFNVGGTQATLRGMVGWRHAFADASTTAALATTGGASFSVAGVPIAADAAVIEAGADFSLQPNLTLGLSYAGQLGNGVRDHGVKANLLWKF